MTPAKHPLIGQTLGGSYRVVKLIGEGGMGTVYEAMHTRVERRFAIKVLDIKLTSNEEATARFQREAMIGSRLGHDHIIAVTDFDHTPDGHPFLVMELVEGEDLSYVLQRERRLPLLRAASITRQVALALEAAHAEGVVHRDLKPENIFICQRSAGGELAKVMDFGVAKVLESRSIVTQDASILGTPSYMSPEQAQGRVREIDHRTDIFSLGLVLYQMLSGKIAFSGPTATSVLFQVVHQEPPPLDELAPDLPPGVVDVVRSAIEKDKSNRPESATAVVEALAEALGDRWRDVLVLELGAGPEIMGKPIASAVKKPAGGPPADPGLQSALSATEYGPAAGEAEPNQTLFENQGTSETLAFTGEPARPGVSVAPITTGEKSSGIHPDGEEEEQEEISSARTISVQELAAGGIPSSPSTPPTRETAMGHPLSEAPRSPEATGRQPDRSNPATSPPRPEPLPDGQEPPQATGRLPDARQAPPMSGASPDGPEPQKATAQLAQHRSHTTLSNMSGEVATTQQLTGEPGKKATVVLIAMGIAALAGAGIGGYLLTRTVEKGGPPRAVMTRTVKPGSTSPGSDSGPAPERDEPGTRQAPRAAQDAAAVVPPKEPPKEKPATARKAPRSPRRTPTARKTPPTRRVDVRPAPKPTPPVEPRPNPLAPATLNVVTLFEGSDKECDVYLDGKLEDQTPANLPGLKPGKHRLKVTCKGFKTQKRSVTLAPGKRRRVVIGLERR